MTRKTIRRRDFSEFTPSPEFGDDENFVARLFHTRGETLFSKNNYQLNALIKPYLLKNIDQAVTLLIEALEQQKRIVIIGDFDADGATSTALLYKSLKAFGFQNIAYLIPNRFEFGYGLTPEIVNLAAQNSPELLITVDNGISSHEGVECANRLGIKVLITDHHLSPEVLPKAEVIVNPNQADCQFPSKNLAGVGVIFYVMLALRSALKEKGFFKGVTAPNMAQYLDLLALGTVADVVPLDRNNRVLVAQGLARIRSGKSCAGIRALLAISGKNPEKISSSDLGFTLGPRLNAAGRLDEMSLGVRCLLTDDEGEALEIAQELDSLNRDRKLIESSMQAQALKLLENLSEHTDVPAALCIFQPDFHQGVSGIVASRMKDKYHRPTIVFARIENGELKGSGRSIPGIHLRDALDEVAKKIPAVLSKFGGHAMAAGLSIKEEDLPIFEAAFSETVEDKLTDDVKYPLVFSDGALASDRLNIDCAELIRSSGPWGQGFPEPVFDGNFKILQQRIVGEKHLKLVVCLVDDKSVVCDAIQFGADLSTWPDERIEEVTMAYRLDINEYRGRKSVQLLVDYLEPIAGESLSTPAF